MANPIQCPSCAKLFQFAAFLEGSECPACVQAGQVTDPSQHTPQCGCGKVFVCLNPTVWCGACQALDTESVRAQVSAQDHLLDAVNRGIRNRPNPKNDPNGQRLNMTAQSSASILNLMQMKKRVAHTQQFTHGGPVPAPLNGLGRIGGTADVNGLIPAIFVAVMELRVNNVKAKNFSPYHGTFNGSLDYVEILEKVREHVDRWGLEQVPPMRFFNPKDVELRFQSTGLAPSDSQVVWKTLYELFISHNSTNYRTKKDIKQGGLCLNFVAWARYREPLSFIPRLGSTSSSTTFSTIVRTRVLTDWQASASAPPPPPPVKKTPLLLYRTTMEEEVTKNNADDNDASDEDQPVELKMITTAAADEYFLHEGVIGKGVTKKVSKLEQVCDGESSFYAAKWFFRGADKEDISPQQNIEYINEELERASNAIAIGLEFMAEAQGRNVAIHDVQFLKPMILHEKPTLEEGGTAYLCDQFIPGPMKKYSGTDKPGNHGPESHPGQTCDTLAHFSFSATQKMSVLCDLQGIISTENGTFPVLNLFDVQIHTNNQNQGLGDMGPVGIRAFKRQHMCNAMCLAFGLPPFSQVISQSD